MGSSTKGNRKRHARRRKDRRKRSLKATGLNRRSIVVYSVAEVSTMCGISESTVRRDIKAGRLRVARTGAGANGRILISHNALEEYLNVRPTSDGDPGANRLGGQ